MRASSPSKGIAFRHTAVYSWDLPGMSTLDLIAVDVLAIIKGFGFPSFSRKSRASRHRCGWAHSRRGFSGRRQGEGGTEGDGPARFPVSLSRGRRGRRSSEGVGGSMHVYTIYPRIQRTVGISYQKYLSDPYIHGQISISYVFVFCARPQRKL